MSIALQQLKANLAKKEKSVLILQSRLDTIEKAVEYFDNSSHDTEQGLFHDDYDTYLAETNEEFNEQCRSEFGACMGRVLREVSSSYGMFYNEYVDNLPHELFSDYTRLVELTELIESRISDRECEVEDLEEEIEELEVELEEESLIKR